MAWYTNWTRAQQLVITVPVGTVAPVSYFPVVLTASCLPTELTNNTYGSSTGADLAFAADLGLGNTQASIGVQLPCEVVVASFGGSPAAEIHVQVPNIAATGTLTYIWVLYGNAGQSAQPAANSTYGSQSVWIENGASNLMGVWHLQSTTVTDSTGINAVGTNTGSPTSVAGIFTGSNGLAGASGGNYVTLPEILAMGTNLTAAGISCWVKRASSGQKFGISARDNSNGQLAMYGGSTTVVGLAEGGGQYQLSLTNNLTGWHHYDIVWSAATSLIFYIDGVNTSGSFTGSNPANLNTYYYWPYINYAQQITTNGNASYDEVRFTKVARSVSWVAAEYSNQFAPGTFIAPNGSPFQVTSTSLLTMYLTGF